MIDRSLVSGLVLAGGRGSRMGGVDKGLQLHDGLPLALHALRRLGAQVGPTMLNANRHLEAYAAMDAPVWPDATDDHPGPLAGFLAGLAHCTTPWLATVPCDAPLFPADLVAHLAAGIERSGAEIAVAATREGGALRSQPVFCLMRVSVQPALARFVAAGGRKVEAWAAGAGAVTVEFDDARAFVNVNTAAELADLRGHG